MVLWWYQCAVINGYSEDMLATAFDHLCENEKAAREFLAKNARLRKLWLDGFLFSQLWLVCFMLTVTVALGINFCCSTNIDLSLYYICSLLYYWDDTIVQIMYLFCSDITSRYHFCTPWRCNANGERLMWLFLYKYYGYIQMIIFVLLEICLGNAGAWIWMIIFDVEVDD